MKLGLTWADCAGGEQWICREGGSAGAWRRSEPLSASASLGGPAPRASSDTSVVSHLHHFPHCYHGILNHSRTCQHISKHTEKVLECCYGRGVRIQWHSVGTMQVQEPRSYKLKQPTCKQQAKCLSIDRVDAAASAAAGVSQPTAGAPVKGQAAAPDSLKTVLGLEDTKGTDWKGVHA